MTRIAALNWRYIATAQLQRGGTEIIAVGDPAGARLSANIRQLTAAVDYDDSGTWGDLVGAGRALTWRRLVQPQPVEFNPGLQHAAEAVLRHAGRMRGSVAIDDLLDAVSVSSRAVAASDSPVGAVLLRSIEEVGVRACAVVAASWPSKTGLEAWLREQGVAVFTTAELQQRAPRVDLVYAVGPPRFFPPSLVTAPVSDEVTFVIPEWFRDRRIPHSSIADHAEGAIRISARISTESTAAEAGPDLGLEPDESTAAFEAGLLPQPVWTPSGRSSTEPGSHEVEARKVLLSGDYALWLDDGQRIRTLDPQQPSGERVIYTDVSSVRYGTYLLLRHGDAERGALHRDAMNLLGIHQEETESSQQDWKLRLADRLESLGASEVVRRLSGADIRAAAQARAWTDPSFIRPSRDRDFEHLLQWLGLPVQPTFGRATRLRRMLYQASAAIREELETAISAADLTVMERDGYISLDTPTAGARGHPRLSCTGCVPVLGDRRPERRQGIVRGSEQ
ncbi:MAG: hypothetical protein V9F03_07090 [Microthrixaceae bacterium]